jgi:hypothetical protein
VPRLQKIGRCAGDKSRDHGDRVGSPLDRLTSVVLEVDPPFIETVEHSHAGFGIPHALRAEQPIPWNRSDAESAALTGQRDLGQGPGRTTQLSTFMFYGNLFVGKLLEAKHLGRATLTDVGMTYKFVATMHVCGYRSERACQSSYYPTMPGPALVSRFITGTGPIKNGSKCNLEATGTTVT